MSASANDKTVFGFWTYLMTDCILFASLFAVYAVMHNNTAGGPSANEIIVLPNVLAETLILLTSSFSSGLAFMVAKRGFKWQTISWLIVTFLLGAAFIWLELHEFRDLIAEGASWQRSGFLSAFFTLIAMHGLHISIGLLWLLVSVAYMIRRGLDKTAVKRLQLFTVFWHFLDVIWIFIFTVVYLMGASSLWT